MYKECIGQILETSFRSWGAANKDIPIALQPEDKRTTRQMPFEVPNRNEMKNVFIKVAKFGLVSPHLHLNL